MAQEVKHFCFALESVKSPGALRGAAAAVAAVSVAAASQTHLTTWAASYRYKPVRAASQTHLTACALGQQHIGG